MHWVFRLGALVETREDAEAFIAFFHGRVVPTPGEDIPLGIVMQETGRGWVIGVKPESGIKDLGKYPRATIRTREVVADWFDRELRTAPPFRAAGFGAFFYEDLLDEPLEDLVRGAGMAGLVIDTRVFASLGSPPGTKPFAPGRRWWPRTSVP